MANMDDIIRKMLEDQYALDNYGQSLHSGLLGTTPAGDQTEVNQLDQTTYTPGLLGETPASNQPMRPVNNNAQQTLEGITAKGQQVAQNMADMQQEANQQGAQAAQNLQAQRDSQMSSTEQQAAQLLQQQRQQEAGLGGLLGGLIKRFLIPVKFGGGRK